MMLRTFILYSLLSNFKYIIVLRLFNWTVNLVNIILYYLVWLYNNGSWCRRLLLSAALPSPGMVGSSGMLPRKTSRWFLNMSTCSVLIVLMLSGKRLKILAPLTPKEFSLALLTSAGAFGSIWFGMICLPLRMPPDVNITSYPETKPWLIFDKNIIWYRSILRSWE